VTFILDPLPVHSHASDSQGGQLDWDNIWSDAVHSHESAAEGGLIERFLRNWRTGAYIDPWPNRAVGTVAIVADTLYAAPFMVVRPLTIDRLAIQVTGAGAAGKLARLGIYRDGANLYPGALLADVGAVAVDGVAVVAAAIAGNLALQPGLYWLALLANGAPTLEHHFPTSSPLGWQAADFTLENASWNVAQAYGALPDPFTAAGSLLTGRHFVMPRLLTLD